VIVEAGSATSCHSSQGSFFPKPDGVRIGYFTANPDAGRVRGLEVLTAQSAVEDRAAFGTCNSQNLCSYHEQQKQSGNDLQAAETVFMIWGLEPGNARMSANLGRYACAD